MRRAAVVVAMRRAVAAVVLVALAALLTSCASPHNALNTPASACFRGLPAARAAVGHDARLIGVRRVSKAELSRAVPQAAAIRPGELCLVAFRGPFASGDVTGADPPGPGNYAVVALDTGGSELLGAFVLNDLPVPFHHRI